MANSLNRHVLIVDTASATAVAVGAGKIDTTWLLRIRHITWDYKTNPGDSAVIKDANGNLIYEFTDEMAGKAIAFSDIHAYNGLIVSTLSGGKLIFDLD